LTAAAAGIILHTATVTFTGAARTSNVAMPVTNRVAGDRVTIKCVLPGTDNFIINIRNATTGGTLLYSITTSGAGDASFDLEYDGAAFQPVGYHYPVNTF
jgi:hypothetical protein